MIGEWVVGQGGVGGEARWAAETSSGLGVLQRARCVPCAVISKIIYYIYRII